MHVHHVGLGLSAVAAATPVLVYLIVIWRLDRYEREPLWLVGLVFLYGAVGAIVLGLALSSGVMSAAHITATHTKITAGLIAPLTEEPAKGLIVLLLLLTRHFDNTTDGVIYGAASGLGFAMTENFFYFVRADAEGGQQTWMKVVLLRCLLSALLHCAATAAFGAILGRFRYRGFVLQWLVAPILGLVVAMSLHAAFNSALIASAKDHGYVFIGFALIPMAAITLFTITMISLGREHRMLAAELREEAAMGLLPPAHADILPFHRRRWRKGWLDPRIDKKRYIESATLLAFRKWQSKLPAGRRPDIARHIAELRHQIATLLSKAR
jgi:protease PrsW